MKYFLTLLFTMGLVCKVVALPDTIVTSSVDSQLVATDQMETMDSVATAVMDADSDDELLAEAAEAVQGRGFHQQLKDKFVEGGTGFMSLVAAALVLGLACCIERIVYLSLSEVNVKKLLDDVNQLVQKNDVESAKELCRNTR